MYIMIASQLVSINEKGSCQSVPFIHSSQVKPCGYIRWCCLSSIGFRIYASIQIQIQIRVQKSATKHQFKRAHMI